MALPRYPVAKRDRNPAWHSSPEGTRAPCLRSTRGECSAGLPWDAAQTAINEVRVYGLTYIFTCRKCGQPAGGLVADVPEKDKHPGQKE